MKYFLLIGFLSFFATDASAAVSLTCQAGSCSFDYRKLVHADLKTQLEAALPYTIKYSRCTSNPNENKCYFFFTTNVTLSAGEITTAESTIDALAVQNEIDKASADRANCKVLVDKVVAGTATQQEKDDLLVDLARELGIL